MGAYERPDELDAALGLLAGGLQDGTPWVVLAGGTDHFPARVGVARDERILDITGIAGLAGIGEDEHGFRIGATTTWSAVAETALPAGFDGLKAAAREVGGRQIQNRATIAGNLCNASPAADGMPPLLALDAVVELAGPGGVEQLPLAGFVTGNRATRRRPDQLVTAILVPRAAAEARSVFLKLGARRYLVISIAMVAAAIEVASDRTVAAARLAVGACSAVARRLGGLEAALTGAPLGGLAERVEPGHLDGLAPIDDVRADATYRREAALTLVRRSLATLEAA